MMEGGFTAKRGLASLIALSGALMAPVAGWGQAWLEDTRLAGISMGSSFESTISRAARGSYELEGGRRQSFDNWYASDWRDLSAVFETRLDGLEGDAWFVWGISTGERGEKYRVAPSLIVGYERVWTVEESAFFTIGLRAKLAGRLDEDPCTATYSLVQGPVAVNCRLAASPLPPDETLDYLWDEAPPDRFRVSIGYVVYF